MDGLIDILIDRWIMYIYMNLQNKDWYLDKQIDGKIEKQIDVKIEKQIDVKIEKQIDVKIEKQIQRNIKVNLIICRQID